MSRMSWVQFPQGAFFYATCYNGRKDSKRAYVGLLRKHKLHLLLVFEELNRSLDDALDAYTRGISAPTRSFVDSLQVLERHLREVDEPKCPSDPHLKSARRRGKKALVKIARRLLSVRCIQSKRHKHRVKSYRLCRAKRSKSASTGRPHEGAEITKTPACVPSIGSFPDLELEQTSVPYIRLSEPGADFSNSKNECAQLSAWIETLDRERTVTLLRMLSMYRAGSLYQFMLVWCQAAEGFDPLTGKDSTKRSRIDLNFYNPNDEGRLMWNYIETRSATQHVNLQRILHLLLYLYSNDRLTTRTSLTFGDLFLNGAIADPSTMPLAEFKRGLTGRPGELVRKMTYLLRNPTGPSCITSSRRRVFKSPAHRNAAEVWTDEPYCNFESLAPGFVDYMLTYLGSLKRLLKFPPFDDAFPFPLLENLSCNNNTLMLHQKDTYMRNRCNMTCHDDR